MIPGVSMATQVSLASETQLVRYTRWALAITFACMPLYVVRWHVGPIPTTLLENLVFVTIGLYVVARTRSAYWPPERTSLEVPILLFLVAGLIGIAVSYDHVGALGHYRAYFIEPVILLYIAIDLLRTAGHFRTVLLGLVIGTTVFAIMNLGAWAIALAHHEVITPANAPEALYTSPNEVALFLEPPLAIAAGFALHADQGRDRKVALGCLVFLLPALVLTLSRGGLLTMAVLALVAVATMPQLRLKLALLGGAVVGGLAVSQVPWVASRLARQLDLNYRWNTLAIRSRIWGDTLHMLRDHPIFGAGIRAYSRVMVPYVTDVRVPEILPHNIWLAMWAEIGLLGLASFAVIMALLLWRGWRAFARATGFYRALLWGTSAAFVAIAVHGFFDTPYFKNDLAVEFWMLAALEIAAIRALAYGGTGNRRLER